MRPYLALIKDSFRAAIASNVLYVLLLCITLLLLAIAPLHVQEVLDWQLKLGGNVPKPDSLAQRLVERGEDPERPAVNRVWELLPQDLQADLKTMVAYQEDESTMPDSNKRVMHEMNTRKRLIKELNEIIKSRDFYEEEAWAAKRFNDEAQNLLDSDLESLSDERMKRLNRLLMASTFGGLVRRGGGNALELWYGPWRWEDMTFNVSHNEFAKGTLSTLTWFFDKFVMSIGLFIAILVTANIIPETFLPGSLNLLLSKPISRSGLLIAKFIGGCAFVSLCAVYLFLGLWLWLGIGMGIWDKGILWGIPLYIIVFAIYYSVSTLVGVWSRSQILAIVVTALFWAACFLVGLAHQVIGGRIENSRTRDLIAVQDQVLQVGELSTISGWDEASSSWNQKLEMKMADEQRVAMGFVMFAPGAGDDNDLSNLGPIYDPKHDQILAGMIDLSNPTSVNYKDLYASPTNKIEFTEVGKFPRNTLAVFSDVEGVIAVLSDGSFQRYQGSGDVSPQTNVDDQPDPSKAGDESESKRGSLTDAFKSLTNNITKKELFVDIGPGEDRVRVSRSGNVAHNPDTREMVTYRDGTITKFAPGSEGNYEKVLEQKLETGVRDDMPALIATAGDHLVVALGNGEILLLDATTLEQRNSYRPQKSSPFRRIVASSDGTYFVFYCRNKTLWMLDTTDPQAVTKVSLADQGDVTAAQFDDQDRLWVSTQANNADLIDLKAEQRVKSVRPAPAWYTRLFNYVVDPFYLICPKPGEFYKIVTHLSATPDESETDVDLNALTSAKDPWQPLWGGLLFMCGVLFVSCMIFQFRDF